MYTKGRVAGIIFIFEILYIIVYNMFVTKNKIHKPGKYTIDIDQKLLRKTYLKEWVLLWCEKYHPEAYIQGDRFLKDNFDSINNKKDAK